MPIARFRQSSQKDFALDNASRDCRFWQIKVMRPLTLTMEPSPEVETSEGTIRGIAVRGLLGLLSCALIIAYASIGRPLWIDEFLHFAFAGFRSTVSAWHAIRHSIGSINFGQTGIYMLLDYWLLKAFGANLLALRLPSILSAWLMLWGGLEFLRRRRYQAIWQFNLIVCYLGQATLMYYTGEARPYMALAGASVGAFTYYVLTPEERRSRSVRILGWLSILWGAAIHPYFAFYWLSLFAFGYLIAVYEERTKFSWKAAILHLNVTLSIFGSLIYFGIGFATWLAHTPKLSLDPFQWVSQANLYATFVELSHFQFLGRLGSSWLLFTVALFLVHFCLNDDAKKYSKRLIAPCLLTWIAIFLSVYVSWESFTHHYWILPRQWVASIALIPIAFIWLCAELTNLIAQVSMVARWLIPLACLFLVAFCSYPQTVSQSHSFLVAILNRSSPEKFIPPPRSALPTDNDGWVALANRNVDSGGPVSSVFQFFYRPRSR